MKMHQITIGLLLPLLLAAAGCETVNSTERENPLGQKTMVQDRRITSDVRLNDAARIVGVNEGKTPEGLLRIQVKIFNATWTSHNIFYTFEWLDGNGMIVETAVAGWTEMQIIGQDSRLINGIAPDKSVVDFRFKMKQRN